LGGAHPRPLSDPYPVPYGNAYPYHPTTVTDAYAHALPFPHADTTDAAADTHPAVPLDGG